MEQGRTRNFIVWMFSLMSFVLVMVAFVFGGILDQVAVTLDVSVAQSGLLNSVYLYGAAIGTPIVLILFRRSNRAKMLKVSLAITILATLALVMVNTFQFMLITRFIMGISANSYGALAITTLMSVTPKERQGRAMSLFIMGGSLALVIGIPLTRILSSVLNWKGIFWILIAMMVASLIVFIVALKNEGQEQTNLNLKHELSLIKEPMILNILSFTLIIFIGYGAFYTYVTPYLILLFPTIESLMSVMLIALGVAVFLGNLLGGHIADRIGYRKAMLIGGLWQLTAIVLIIATQTIMWINLLVTLIWLAGAWFTGLQINTGIVQATHNKSSFLISLNSLSNQLGTALGASIAAVVINQTDIKNIVIVAMIAAGVVTVSQYISLKKSPNVKQVLVEDEV